MFAFTLCWLFTNQHTIADETILQQATFKSSPLLSSQQIAMTTNTTEYTTPYTPYYDNEINTFISFDNNGNKIYNSKCFDIHRQCPLWSLQNECNNNPEYMHIKCAYSCQTCDKQTYSFRNQYCQNKWSTVENNDEYDCYKWKNDGYCKQDENNEYQSWMYRNCQKACNVCDYERRCNPNKYRECAHNFESKPEPNMYNTIFFNRILKNKWLSWKYGAKLVSFDPPVLYFENFIPESVVKQFINDTSDLNYRRSVDITGTYENGSLIHRQSSGRTSANAWCRESCQLHNSTQTILSSMEQITGINREYYEHLQILKYDKSNYYHLHHDFIQEQSNMICGGRILTLFIYLTNVDIGGETKFPKLNIKMKPKLGTAILWPNVYSNNLRKRIPQTYHTALPVIKGYKISVNAWIHPYNYINADDFDCSG